MSISSQDHSTGRCPQMLYIIIRSTHILNHNLPCAKAETWDLNSLSCGKWRKISKPRYELDLDRQC